jgi:transposase
MFGDAPVVIDATNNTSFVEMVQDVCSAPVEGFKISSVTRPFIINELALAIEKKTLSLPDGRTKLGRYCCVEISAFAYVEKAGKKRMEAPQGYHDDVVFALALAHYARMNMASGGTYFRQASREEGSSLRDDLSPLNGEEPKKGNVVSGGARKKRINRLST